MNTSNLTYKDLAIPYFREVFEIIDETMQKHNVPFYLIGASAVSLQLMKKGIKPGRGTKDIDFAIMISSYTTFKAIYKSLEERSFTKVRAPWTFYHRGYNIVNDILPFGEIEQEFTLNFNKRKIDLHVLGLTEVVENPEEVFIEDKIAKIPALPGMVILKLVAWSDRPEVRPKDLADILKIIEHYFEFNQEEIIESHNDIFPDEDIDLRKVAARVLGRESREYLDSSPRLEQRVMNVLKMNIENFQDSKIVRNWAGKLTGMLSIPFLFSLNSTLELQNNCEHPSNSRPSDL